MKKSGNNSFLFLSYVFISLRTFTHRGIFFFSVNKKNVLFYYKSTSLFLDRSYLSQLSHCGRVQQPVTTAGERMPTLSTTTTTANKLVRVSKRRAPFDARDANDNNDNDLKRPRPNMQGGKMSSNS